MASFALFDRIKADPAFAKDLEGKVQAVIKVPATSGNVTGPEWSALLNAIAESPEDKQSMIQALNRRSPDSPERLAKMVSNLKGKTVVADIPTTTTTTTTSVCVFTLTGVDCVKLTIEIIE
jgi:hypothetical protein